MSKISNGEEEEEEEEEKEEEEEYNYYDQFFTQHPNPPENDLGEPDDPDDDPFQIHEEGEDADDYQTILEKLSESWLLVEVDHTVSKVAANAYWKHMMTLLPRLLRKKKMEQNTSKIPQFNHIRKKMHDQKVPKVNLELGYKCKETGEIKTVHDTVTKKSTYPPHEYIKLYEIATVQTSDVIALHELKCHSAHENQLQLSCDSVSESKSTNISLDVYSTCFKNCKNIYPHKIVRPLGKYKLNSRKHLSDVLKDITDNNFRISQYVGDNPKRSDAKEVCNHASWFPCEYCFAKGVKVVITANAKAKKSLEDQLKIIDTKIRQSEREPQSDENDDNRQNLLALQQNVKKSISKLQKKSNILWPSSTLNSTHRSRNSVLEIIQKIENGENLTHDEAKGIKGRSLLLGLPDFNYIYDVPAEYLHSGCLGVTKRLVELTFNVGSGVKRIRVTKRKLSPTSKFNELMREVKVFKELSRRARNLDFAVFKGQEFRNIGLFFFPLVIECIEEGEKERNLWLYLAYMLRSSVIPSEEFSPINLQVIEECCHAFYKLFEKLFGVHNCTYNLHVFCGHLTEIRTHGPLTETSAFKFEAFYGELRKAFVPGTISPTKQIMQNVYLKRSLSHHSCVNSMFLSNYDTSMECNKLVYTYTRNKYNLYEISDIGDNMVTCYEVGKYDVHFDETPNLDWSQVGFFKKGALSAVPKQLNVNEISGKVLNVGKYLLTCPNNVLNEK